MAPPPWRPPGRRRCCRLRTCARCLCSTPWATAAGSLVLVYSIVAMWTWWVVGRGFCSLAAHLAGSIGSTISALATTAALGSHYGYLPTMVGRLPAASSIIVIVASGGSVVAESGVRSCCSEHDAALFPTSACAAASEGRLDLLGAIRPGLIALGIAVASALRLGSGDFAAVGCALVAGATAAIVACPSGGFNDGNVTEVLIGCFLLFAAARAISHVVGHSSTEPKVCGGLALHRAPSSRALPQNPSQVEPRGGEDALGLAMSDVAAMLAQDSATPRGSPTSQGTGPQTGPAGLHQMAASLSLVRFLQQHPAACPDDESHDLEALARAAVSRVRPQRSRPPAPRRGPRAAPPGAAGACAERSVNPSPSVRVQASEITATNTISYVSDTVPAAALCAGDAIYSLLYLLHLRVASPETATVLFIDTPQPVEGRWGADCTLRCTVRPWHSHVPTAPLLMRSSLP